jgi:hypothetical protein
MKGFFGGLQTTPIASVAHGYGLEVLGPHVRRQEVDKRCLENIFLRYLALSTQSEQQLGQVEETTETRGSWQARRGPEGDKGRRCAAEPGVPWCC